MDLFGGNYKKNNFVVDEMKGRQASSACEGLAVHPAYEYVLGYGSQEKSSLATYPVILRDGVNDHIPSR